LEFSSEYKQPIGSKVGRFIMACGQILQSRFTRCISFPLSGFVIVFYSGRRDQITNFVHLREATDYVHVKIITFEIDLTRISERN
jgi:hypothetical protein